MKNKIIAILASIILSSINLMSNTIDTLILEPPADTTMGWKYGGNMGLTFNQISFTNWVQGGENAISGASFLGLFANYKIGKWDWENFLNLGYGLLTNSDDKARKTDDRIDVNSKIGRKVFDNFYFSFLMSYKTQFAKGYNYPNDSVVVSRFMAPGYIILSLGLDYKPYDWISVYFSPATGRLIFVDDDTLSAQGAYGVEKGKHFRPDFGWYINLTMKKEILENIFLFNRLSLFDNYTDPVPNKRLNIVVDWETGLVLKVSKYISANVNTRLIYDHNISIPIYKKINGLKTQIGAGPRTQFKELFGIGLVFGF